VHDADNNLGVAGAEVLAPALKQMNMLKEFSLNGEFVIGRVLIGEGVQRCTIP